ncbi:MAG: dihydroorotate dehydrogenase [Oscillospiraceae bacterium]|nr:dihydroorotate dehydrogenase [Oscillospiraceae bacterium]
MNTNINLAGIKMKNPIVLASGTCGYGRELDTFFELNKVGGLITKGTTLKPKDGNPPSRICETPSGLINSIGLQNPGVDHFIQYDLPWLRKQDTAIIVNACGSTIEEYIELCKILNEQDIDGVELNLSCPNVKAGCLAFGTSYEGVKEVTSKVRKVLDKPLIVKLTPNITDITESARGAEDAGADGISLINTLLAMSINIETKKPYLANNMGGLSGPAVRPVAVRMVYQAAKAARIPVLGMGGAINGKDVIEFMMAGATAVAIGSGTLRDPFASVKAANEVEQFMAKHKIKDINSIIGSVQLHG